MGNKQCKNFLKQTIIIIIILLIIWSKSKLQKFQKSIKLLLPTHNHNSQTQTYKCMWHTAITWSKYLYKSEVGQDMQQVKR